MCNFVHTCIKKYTVAVLYSCKLCTARVFLFLADHEAIQFTNIHKIQRYLCADEATGLLVPYLLVAVRRVAIWILAPRGKVPHNWIRIYPTTNPSRHSSVAQRHSTHQVPRLASPPTWPASLPRPRPRLAAPPLPHGCQLRRACEHVRVRASRSQARSARHHCEAASNAPPRGRPLSAAALPPCWAEW